MTPQNTPASDEEKCRATLKRVMEYLYSMSDEKFAREIEIRKEGDVAMIMREVLEARTESRDEIAKMRELLQRSKFLVHCDYCYQGNCQPKLCMKRQWLRDYAALTKGVKE